MFGVRVGVSVGSRWIWWIGVDSHGVEKKRPYLRDSLTDYGNTAGLSGVKQLMPADIILTRLFQAPQP